MPRASAVDVLTWVRSRREAKRSPDTGKLFRRPDSTWAGLISLSAGCADFFSACSSPLDISMGPQRAFLKASGNLSADDGVLPDLDRSAASRQRLPSKLDDATGGMRHRHHRSDEFQPAIPWWVARQHCPLPLHRLAQLTMAFPIANQNRTFLLCREPDISTLR